MKTDIDVDYGGLSNYYRPFNIAARNFNIEIIDILIDYINPNKYDDIHRSYLQNILDMYDRFFDKFKDVNINTLMKNAIPYYTGIDSSYYYYIRKYGRLSYYKIIIIFMSD